MIKFVPSQCQFTRISVAGSIRSSHGSRARRERTRRCCTESSGQGAVGVCRDRPRSRWSDRRPDSDGTETARSQVPVGRRPRARSGGGPGRDGRNVTVTQAAPARRPGSPGPTVRPGPCLPGRFDSRLSPAALRGCGPAYSRRPRRPARPSAAAAACHSLADALAT